jgi:hypothetical protein
MAMTDSELVEGSCRIQSRFNEILYQLKNASSDTLENLSDLKEQYDTNAGRLFDENFTYAQDILVSFENEIYVSLQNTNLANIPNLSPTFWQKIDVKNLTTGRYYASAFANIVRAGSSAVYDWNLYTISVSKNFQTLEHLGDGVFKLTFDGSGAGIYDNNYLVMLSDNKRTFAVPFSTFLFPVYNIANIIQKTATYLIIKIPHNRYAMQFNITLIPLQ